MITGGEFSDPEQVIASDSYETCRCADKERQCACAHLPRKIKSFFIYINYEELYNIGMENTFCFFILKLYLLLSVYFCIGFIFLVALENGAEENDRRRAGGALCCSTHPV